LENVDPVLMVQGGFRLKEKVVLFAVEESHVVLPSENPKVVGVHSTQDIASARLWIRMPDMVIAVNCTK
jgi:hypothetical protein